MVHCPGREALDCLFAGITTERLQVDKYNPDNTPNSAEVELMTKAGEIAQKA